MRLRQLLSVLISILTSSSLLAFSLGVTCGTLALLGLSVAINVAGFSQAVVIGFLLAAAVGIDAGLRFGRLEPATRWCWRGLMVCWSIATPSLSERTLSLFSNLFGSLALSDAGGVIAGLLVGLISLAVPVFFLVSELREGLARTNPAIGVAGIVSALVATIPLAGMFASATLATVSCLSVTAILLIGRFLRLRFGKQIAEEPAKPHAFEPNASIPLWLQGAALLIAGCAVPLLSRVLSQTMTGSLYCIGCGIAGTIIGFAMAKASVISATSWWQEKLGRVRGAASPVVAAGLFGVSLASTVLLFPQLVQLQLHVNATIDTPWLVLASRGLVAGLFFLPVGFLFGAVLNRSSAYPLPGLTFSLGAIAMTSLLTSDLGIAALVVALAMAGGSLCCILVKPTTGAWVPSGRLARAAFVTVMALLAATPLMTSRFQPDVAARLLFSSGIFREYADGTDMPMLLASTDARALGSVESAVGTKSAWRLGGSQVQVRRNGVSVAVSSSNPITCPQTTTAALPAVIPLLLRSFPQDVLFLGDSGPVAESTALRFAVRSVTTMHQQLRTVPELDNVLESRRKDERFRHLAVSPKIGLAGLSHQYDVVISNPPPTADLDAAAYYTTDFYHRVEQHVAADGLFCQMFRQIDFGPEPMERVLASLAEAFTTVSAVRLEAGEILLLGTNGNSIIEPGMAKRTQKPATRQLLDELAWDWSKVLELASLDSESVAAITSVSMSQNTVANSSLLWSLPFETMRWDDKKTEIRQSLAAYQRRILDQLEEDDYRAEAARRIAELQEEREVLFGFPDEPWVYRRTLRSRLEKHPRPPEPIVKGGTVKRQAHATDRYRIEYFKVLANAIHQSHSKPEAIRGLESFVAPTEPLLSYFASHEAARLLASVGDQPDAELFHRFRTVYFTPASSRSVRDIVATINLIVEKPELIPDPADRWDRMNSLLQTMMNRWGARVDIAPDSAEIAINDVDLCLAAYESGLAAMHTWSKECDVDEVTMAYRSRYLRRRLENPLRGYRDKLLPHYDRSESIAGEESESFGPLGN